MGTYRAHRRLLIEELEPRIAPAVIWDEMGIGSASGGGISQNSEWSVSPSMAIDRSGRPVIAWSDDSSGNSEIYVRRWDGQSWAEYMSGSLGSATGAGISNTNTYSVSPSIVVGMDNYPVVAWTEWTPGGTEIYVRRYDGISWAEYQVDGLTHGSASGGGMSATANATTPSITLGTNGQPLIAWTDSSSNRYQIYVRYWDNNVRQWAEWANSGRGQGISSTSGTAGFPVVTIAWSQQPLVVWMNRRTTTDTNWEIYAKSWDGASWMDIAGSSTTTGENVGGISSNTGNSMYPSVAVLDDQNPIVVWDDYTSGNWEIYAKKFDGQSWVQYGTDPMLSATGGGISNTTPGDSWFPSVSLDASGRPVVYWIERRAGFTDVYARYWDGSSWAEFVDAFSLGSATGGGISRTGLAGESTHNQIPAFFRRSLSSGLVEGAPIVTWHDWSQADYEIYVRRFGTDRTPPTAAVTAGNIIAGGVSTYQFTVRYTDNVAILRSSIGDGDVRVVGPNNYSEFATFVSINIDSDGTPRTVTYQVPAPYDSRLAPNRIWGSPDNGVYAILIEPFQVSDLDNNYIEATTLGTFLVNCESNLPGVTGMSLSNVTTGGGTDYTFTITYADNVAIYVPSLDSFDVQVIGPTSSQTATLISVNPPTNGTPRTATYSITAPAGVWDRSDEGSYTVLVLPNAISDTSKNFVASTQGSFQVIFERVAPAAALTAGDITVGGGATYNFTVRYTDNVAIVRSSLDNYDMRVTGPNDYNQLAALLNVVPNQNGPSLLATYQIQAPDNSWGGPDSGTYTISVELDQVSDTSENYLPAGILGTFQVNIEQTPPNTTLSAPAVTTGGGIVYNFSVTYTDAFGVDVSTLDSNDIRVTAPDASWQMASFVSIDIPNNGSPRTVTYQITPPGGMWGSPDNGTYVVSILANQVRDTNKNYIPARDIGTFTVNCETTRPIVTNLNASNITTGGGATYSFTVTYADNVAILWSSLGTGDVRVTGPSSYNQLASFVSVDIESDGTPRTATYRINAPGGMWGSPDNGTYTVSVEAAQVSDTSENTVLPGNLGTFLVTVENTPPTAALTAGAVTSGSGTTYEFTVRYSDNVAVLASSIDNNDILVTDPFGGTQSAMLVSATPNTNGTPITALYRIIPPGGFWNKPDEGTYTISMRANQVSDTGKNFVAAGVLGTFQVLLETTLPAAASNTLPITVGGQTTYSFTVTYTDNVAVLTSTIDSNDVRVSGPNAFSQLATLVSVDNATNGTPRTATYRITAPDGRWAVTHNGQYVLEMQANQVSDTSENYVLPGNYLGTFQVNIESVRPTASLSVSNIGSAGGTTHTFTVTYTDNIAVWRATIDNNDIRVTGPNAYNQLASLVSISGTTDGTPLTATYRIIAPGGTWNAEDVGTYTVSMESNQVADISQNYVLPGSLGTFSVVIETVPPTAAVTAGNIILGSGTTQTITVRYSDNAAIYVASLDTGDIRVSGPNGFSQTAAFISVDNPTDGSPRTATYRITAPGGTWGSNDNGTYLIWAEPNQVRDINENYLAAGTLGSFVANMETAPPTTALTAPAIVNGGGTIYTFQVTYTDPSGVIVSTIDGNDIRVTGPSGFDQAAEFMGVNNPLDGSPRTAMYRILAPAGTWGSPDNGTYTIWMQLNQVSDLNENFVPASSLGDFLVGIETVPPLATLLAPPLIVNGDTTYTFNVLYTDNVALATNTLDSLDLRVQGPGGYNAPATLVGVDNYTDGTPRTATYVIPAPGGVWNYPDNGTYNVVMQLGEVRDTNKNFIPAGSIGTFEVNVSRLVLLPGQPLSFTDADDTLVTMTLSGLGFGEVFLTNGLASGAPILSIVLQGTTHKSRLSVQTQGGAVPGTTFRNLIIDSASGSTNAFGSFSANTLHLEDGGRIDADGNVKALALGDIGNNALLLILANLDSFTAATVGEDVQVTVSGNIGSLSANTVGAGSQIQATGNISMIKTIAGGFSGDVQAGGQLGGLSVSGGGLNGRIEALGRGGIGVIRIEGDHTGSIIAAAGGLKDLQINGVAQTEVTAGGTVGRVRISGPATLLNLRTTNSAVKDVQLTGGPVNATITAAGDVGQVRVTGVGGLLNVTTPRTVKNLTFAAMGGVPSVISGFVDARSLTTLNAPTANLEDFTVYAPEGIGTVKALNMQRVLLVAGSINTVTTLGHMADTSLLSGFGLAPNHTPGQMDGRYVYPYGNGNIRSVIVGGHLIRSNIIAGVHPGADGLYGGTSMLLQNTPPSDDYITRRLSLKGEIGQVKVTGHIYGATDTNGMPLYSPGSGAIEAAGTIGRVSDMEVSLAKPKHVIYGGIVIRSFL